MLRGIADLHGGPAGRSSLGDAALRLSVWAVSVFAPNYARRTTPTFRWRGQWRHPEAISRRIAPSISS